MNFLSTRPPPIRASYVALPTSLPSLDTVISAYAMYIARSHRQLALYVVSSGHAVMPAPGSSTRTLKPLLSSACLYASRKLSRTLLFSRTQISRVPRAAGVTGLTFCAIEHAASTTTSSSQIARLPFCIARLLTGQFVIGCIFGTASD